MIDTDRQKPVRVSTPDPLRPYILVSKKHLEQVRQLLVQNGIPHWVEHNAISIDGGPFVVGINLREGVDPNHVQTLLDRAG